jgi:hypothetical protein
MPFDEPLDGRKAELVNAGLVLFGLWCYLARVRPDRLSGRVFAWFWTCLELTNGVGHCVLPLSRSGYFPGVAGRIG